MRNGLNIIAPPDKRLVWYLSMEEYVAQHIADNQLLIPAVSCDSEVFFTWVVPPTVIFGRHQVMAAEVNIDYCREHDVAMYRRKSGGGCVYSDGGNLMLSYVTSNTHSEQVFSTYLDRLAGALRQLGFDAARSEHNDILVGDRKVSGNACYALPTGTIVHGTMLYDVDFAALQQAITPSREKLSKHGVQSVRQRVANLRDLAAAPDFACPKPEALRDIRSLAAYFTDCFCGAARVLSKDETAAIDRIEQTYLTPDFIAGK